LGSLSVCAVRKGENDQPMLFQINAHLSVLPICPSTVSSCSDMLLWLWLLCGRRATEFWLPGLRLTGAHPLTTTHLVVWPLFPHAQIVCICSLTFVSCLRMYFLLWWLCLVPATEFWLARLPACDRAPSRSPRGTWSTWDLFRMRKSFQYALRSLVHAQVWSCCCGCSGVSSRLRGEGCRAERSHAVCSVALL
jgi:hypothetical protein